MLLAVVILKVCFLQNLYMTFIDLEGGAKSDWQASQNIITLHEEKWLSIDFLMKRAKQRMQVHVDYMCFKWSASHWTSVWCTLVATKEDHSLTWVLNAAACSGKPAAVK